jgi:hypothetical protein
MQGGMVGRTVNELETPWKEEGMKDSETQSRLQSCWAKLNKTTNKLRVIGFQADIGTWKLQNTKQRVIITQPNEE